MSYLKRLTNAVLGRLQAFRMYGGIGMSASSLHRESTDSLIITQYSKLNVITEHPYLLSAPPCSKGEVRLLKDRVQTCHNEVWNYVCTEVGWKHEDAIVVCRELGLSPEGIY